MLESANYLIRYIIVSFLIPNNNSLAIVGSYIIDRSFIMLVTIILQAFFFHHLQSPHN